MKCLLLLPILLMSCANKENKAVTVDLIKSDKDFLSHMKTMYAYEKAISEDSWGTKKEPLKTQIKESIKNGTFAELAETIKNNEGISYWRALLKMREDQKVLFDKFYLIKEKNHEVYQKAFNEYLQEHAIKH